MICRCEPLFKLSKMRSSQRSGALSWCIVSTTERKRIALGMVSFSMDGVATNWKKVEALLGKTEATQKIDEYAGIRTSGGTQTLLNFGPRKGKKGVRDHKTKLWFDKYCRWFHNKKLWCNKKAYWTTNSQVNGPMLKLVDNFEVTKSLTGIKIHKLLVQCVTVLPLRLKNGIHLILASVRNHQT